MSCEACDTIDQTRPIFFNLKSIPGKFHKDLESISWVIAWMSSYE